MSPSHGVTLIHRTRLLVDNNIRQTKLGRSSSGGPEHDVLASDLQVVAEDHGVRRVREPRRGAPVDDESHLGGTLGDLHHKRFQVGDVRHLFEHPGHEGADALHWSTSSSMEQSAYSVRMYVRGAIKTPRNKLEWSVQLFYYNYY